MAEKKIGTLIDELYKIREAARAKSHEAEALRSTAYAVEQELLSRFDKAALSGAAGRVAKLAIRTIDEPTVEDFPKLVAYANRRKAYGLLQRRLNGSAVRELWEEKKTIPGVGVFTRIKVSVTKLTK